MAPGAMVVVWSLRPSCPCAVSVTASRPHSFFGVAARRENRRGSGRDRRRTWAPSPPPTKPASCLLCRPSPRPPLAPRPPPRLCAHRRHHPIVVAAASDDDDGRRDLDATVRERGLEAGLWAALTARGGPRGGEGEADGDGGGDGGATDAKVLLKRYGGAYLVTSVSLSLVSFGLCFAAVSAGVDVGALLRSVGLDVAEGSGRERAGAAALAYAAHKALSPVRFPPTVALTPVVAGWLGRPEPEEKGEEEAGE